MVMWAIKKMRHLPAVDPKYTKMWVLDGLSVMGFRVTNIFQ